MELEPGELKEETASMLDPDLSGEEIAQRGKQLYEQHIRAQVETADNIGKIISMDIVTGDYEIDDDLLETVRRLRTRHPNAVAWTERIGFNAVYSIGGTLTRTAL